MQSLIKNSSRTSPEGTVDLSAVYIGIADGVFLLLALWLTLASLTPAHPASVQDGRPAITIKPDTGQPVGKTQSPEGGETHQPTHQLEGRLVELAAQAPDGALVVEVPYEVFQTLQQASSVRVISHK